jgi:hypothetical protein
VISTTAATDTEIPIIIAGVWLSSFSVSIIINNYEVYDSELFKLMRRVMLKNGMLKTVLA